MSEPKKWRASASTHVTCTRVCINQWGEFHTVPNVSHAQTRANSDQSLSKSQTMLIVVSLLLRFLFLFSIFVPHVSALTVIGVQMLSQAARADYVMAGESARLSCSYLITDDTEHVTSVRWTHNSEPVYFATPAPRRGSVSRRPVVSIQLTMSSLIII